MRTSVGALKRHAMPTLPLIPEMVREKLTREVMAEVGVIAATVAVVVILSTALQLGLERYVIAGM